ncbi:Ca(2+)-dependent cysteine protease [Ceratobasidium sp. 392]|nr:Ca(2+)-dependent cysteine protease [Ceratobasidium sp. 392]
MYEIERGSQLASSSEATPGRRRALVIAIQYRGQRWPDVNDKPGTKSMELKASHEDADDVRELLIDQGYCTQDIRLMTDRPGAPSGDIPTCENIARALGELVAWARPSDCLFLYFAGHGKQIFDKEYDEDDGLDETIIPYDWATRFNYDDRGLIVDDFLREAFINKLPEGCQLTAVFDVRLTSG